MEGIELYSERSRTRRMNVIVCLLCANALVVSCSGDPGTVATPQDKPRAVIKHADAPAILCPVQPFTISVSIDTAYISAKCSASIRSYQGGQIIFEVACDTTTTNSFHSLFSWSHTLPQGDYFAVLCLSDNDICNTYTSYDTSEWLYISVGGDNCDEWRTFTFDYYHQGSGSRLDAFPKGLSHTQERYTPGKLSLNPLFSNSYLAEKWLYPDEDSIYVYMESCIDESLGCYAHLLAIQGFKDESGVYYDILGTTWRFEDSTEIATFICVDAIRSGLALPSQALKDEVVSYVTGHELGHVAVHLRDCWSFSNDHAPGPCIMQYFWVDQSTGDINQYCTDGQVHWPMQEVFCDSCVIHLREGTCKVGGA